MASILVNLLRLFSIVLVIRAIFSWVRPKPDSPVYMVSEGIHRITEPVLAPIRKVLPAMGGIDLSPLVVIFGIRLVLIPLVQGL
jgi:YggT family protein